ncbi:uncharacterized protein LOC143461058 isoform X2 [Clavelina lepadiformis]|uniref:uncharacterized protein LOC143461058 isoform X2 n=1 Tax=Clavelina lepadiformis TaxID=159417 RepID=UPI00404187A7
MNVSTNASVFTHRRAFMNRKCPGYLKAGIRTLRESLDDVSDDASSDAGSIHSTTSSRSYRTWKRAQIKRRKAKSDQTRSLCGDAVGRQSSPQCSFDPFTFDIRKTPISSPLDLQNASHIRKDFKHLQHSSSVNMETAPEKLEYKAYNELSTIIQSPVEPYYSSSDLEDFSVDDDDVKQEEYISPLKQWLSVDEHKDTRDWLISGSFNHMDDQSLPLTALASQSQHIDTIMPLVITSRSAFRIACNETAGGLNDFLSMISSENVLPGCYGQADSKEITVEEIRKVDDIYDEPIEETEKVSQIASSTPTNLKNLPHLSEAQKNEISTISHILSPNFTGDKSFMEFVNDNQNGSIGMFGSGDFTNQTQEDHSTCEKDNNYFSIRDNNCGLNLEQTVEGSLQKHLLCDYSDKSEPPDQKIAKGTSCPCSSLTPNVAAAEQHGPISNCEGKDCYEDITKDKNINDCNGSVDEEFHDKTLENVLISKDNCENVYKCNAKHLSQSKGEKLFETEGVLAATANEQIVVKNPPTSRNTFRPKTLPATAVSKDSLCCCCSTM